jgi:hypothetical protein
MIEDLTGMWESLIKLIINYKSYSILTLFLTLFDLFHQHFFHLLFLLLLLEQRIMPLLSDPLLQVLLLQPLLRRRLDYLGLRHALQVLSTGDHVRLGDCALRLLFRLPLREDAV